jgi:multiple sugar transport system substrate-binding protein
MTSIDRRRFLAAAASTALMLHQAPARAEAKIKLRVTAAPSTVADMYKRMASAFEAAHPEIAIDLDTSQRDYDGLVDATLRDSLTGQLADVSIQGNNKLRLYVDRGMAVELDDLFDAEMASPDTTLSPSVASIGRLRGKIYSLGLSVSVPLLFVNLDLVEKAGGHPNNLPTDWDGIIDLARRMHDAATGTLGGYYAYDQSGAWFWIALIESQGASMMNAAETEIGFGGPEGLKALQILKAFGEAGQSKFDMPRDQVRQLFSAGKLGIIADSSSSLGSYEKQSGGRFKVGTIAFPRLSPTPHFPAGGAMGLVFAKDAERREAAWHFLKLAASLEGQSIIAKNTSYMIANSLVATRSDMLGAFFAERPNMRPVIETLPMLDGWYAFPGQNGGKITKIITDQMRAVILQQVEPEAALAAMTSDVRALLPR